MYKTYIKKKKKKKNCYELSRRRPRSNVKLFSTEVVKMKAAMGGEGSAPIYVYEHSYLN